MKLSKHVRIAALGVAIMTLAGAAGAQTYDDVWVHGNACTGGGTVPSAYGATNNSTAAGATVNCPIAAAWPAPSNSTQERYLMVSYWNRSSVAGAFTCRVYGLDESGNKVYDPGNVALPKGAPGSAPTSFFLGVPPITAKFFSVSCTIPKSSGAGGGSSFLSGIALKIAS